MSNKLILFCGRPERCERRLDLERPVPDEIILQCIDLAEQAPSGANIASRRWLVIRDVEVKAKIAELYAWPGGPTSFKPLSNSRAPARTANTPRHRALIWRRTWSACRPLVIPTIWGEHDGSGRPGLFDSVIQSAWSFCLALRARGLGTAWTTMIFGKREELIDILGIPKGVTPIVLLPVAWTIGTDFKPTARRPAAQITWFDHWGHTNAQPYHGDSLASQPGVTVEVNVEAPPQRLWDLISDVTLPARFSDEFQGAEWLDGDGPRVGARFVGRNRIGDRQWETTSHVAACEAPRLFAWNVSDAEQPSAQWRFELDHVGDSTRLRQCMTMGPGLSGTPGRCSKTPTMPDRFSPRAVQRCAAIWN